MNAKDEGHASSLAVDASMPLTDAAKTPSAASDVDGAKENIAGDSANAETGDSRNSKNGSEKSNNMETNSVTEEIVEKSINSDAKTDARNKTSAEDDEDPMCRFCFEGNEKEKLVKDVCACRGDQRYVHMGCLRRWQRMVLVSQPTHPMFYSDDDRHHICGVCKSPFTCPPPTRMELMQSFTGAEIAALIAPRRFIAARKMFTDMLEEEAGGDPTLMELTSLAHWARSAYLINGVEQDDGFFFMRMDDPEELEMIREDISNATPDEPASIEMQGRTYVINVEETVPGVTEKGLEAALAELELPFTVVAQAPANCSDDTIQAINLTRPMAAPLPNRAALCIEAARAKASLLFQAAADVAVVCYKGGPCHPHMPMACIVMGGPGGYSFSDDLVDAMVLAGKRASSKHDGLVVGQLVELHSLTKAMRHNGSRGILERYHLASGRWVVHLMGGATIRAKSTNIRGLSAGEKGRVLAFFGYAGWSRAQLLGEIARGHWGLCNACLQDICCAPSECREGLESLLVYAPESEMTDEYIKAQLHDMNRLHNEAQQARTHAQA